MRNISSMIAAAVFGSALRFAPDDRDSVGRALALGILGAGRRSNRRFENRSKYAPHQNERECARRRRHIAAGRYQASELLAGGEG